MTSTPIPAVPAAAMASDDGNGFVEQNAPVDSADADRLAAKGEDPDVVEAQEAEQRPSSADADVETSIGEDPDPH